MPGSPAAQIAIDDNSTTGRFLGQSYEILDVPVTQRAEPAASLHELVGTDIWLLTDLDAMGCGRRPCRPGRGHHAVQYRRARRPAASAGVPRESDPRRADPSHADRWAAQYLTTRRWSRWLVNGFASGRRAASGRLSGVGQALWRAHRRGTAVQGTGGARQSDSGVVQVQQQIPVFTQRAAEYDVLVAADENEVFAAHLPYRTWDPRPVAGSAGLRPVTWDASSESWAGRRCRTASARNFTAA